MRFPQDSARSGLPASGSSRYPALDSYRFLAASGVVLYHYDADFLLGFSARLRTVGNLSCMVDFFFVLSGFVIMQGYRDRLGSPGAYGSFLRARLARIYPLHLVILAAYVLLAVAAHLLNVRPNHPEILAPSGLPANLLLVQAWGFLDHPSFNVPAWSISAEWFVYLLAPLVFMIVRHAGFLSSMVLASVLVAVMIVVRHALGAQDWLDSTYHFGMLRALPSFLAGAAIAEAMRRGHLRGRPSWWMAHALAVGALAVLGLDVPRELVLPVFAALIICTALADAGGAPTMMKHPILLALGEASYALYMLHVLVSIPLLAVMRSLHLIDTPWRFAFAAAAYAISIALSLLSYRYFERPVRNWLTGRPAPFGPARQSHPALRGS